MKKQKLIEVREAKEITQKEVAEQLNMHHTCYSKRESGKTKISRDEWDKLAKILGVSWLDIYEEDPRLVVIVNDNGIASGNFCTNDINISMNEATLKCFRDLIEENLNLKKDIADLEEENKLLKFKNKELINDNATL